MRFNPQLKLARHKELVDYIEGRPVYPINVEVSVSGICQARCNECFYAGKQSGALLPTDTVLQFLRDYRGEAITWTGGGEPTNHPAFELFNHRARRFKQGLITNGLRVRDVYMDWIRVSKTNHDWPVENLRRLRQMTPTLGLCVNYGGNSKNDEVGLVEAIRVAEEVGADYIQVRPAFNRGQVKTKIEPPKLKHPKLIVSDYKFEEANRDRDYLVCEGFHFVPFIWEDGRVDVCGYHRGEATYNLGNLLTTRFSEIMKKAPKDVPVVNCQTCCKNHEINRVIDSLKNLEDVDFV